MDGSSHVGLGERRGSGCVAHTCTITYPTSRSHPRSSATPRTGGDEPLYEIRPRRWAFCTASARLRTPSLRYRLDVCSLTVCGLRYRLPAISRFVAPLATASSTSRSRSESGGPAGDPCGLNTVLASPTLSPPPRMSAPGPSL